MNKAVFFDRDGTLIYDRGYMHKPKDLELIPDCIQALNLLKNDFKLFIITNQSGIGRGYFGIEEANKFNNALLNELKKNDIAIRETYICPHSPEENCNCRKPGNKFVMQAKKKFNIDLERSWVVGDHPSDIEMGISSGCRTVYVMTGHGKRYSKDLEKNNIKPDFIADNILEAGKYILNISAKTDTLCYAKGVGFGQITMTKNKLTMTKNKLKTFAELKGIIEALKKQNKKIVTTNGVFDIMHIGHIRYLYKAKNLGDVLIVAVNSDSSTKRIKGEERPINNQNDRAEALAALECVDFVTIFDEDNPIRLLSLIKPDIHVKGKDYEMEEIVERQEVEKNGGKIVLVDLVTGYSTTGIIDKIKKVVS